MADAGQSDTQQAVANLLKIKQPSVSDWKTTGASPSLENAITLGARLNVCVEWILTGRGPKRPGPPMDPAAQALWDAWGRILVDDRQKVVGYAEALVRPSQRRAPKQA